MGETTLGNADGAGGLRAQRLALLPVTVVYFADRRSGGDIYERDLVDGLRTAPDILLREYAISLPRRRVGRLAALPIWTAGTRKVLRSPRALNEVAIATFDAFVLAGRPRSRTIAIVHHLDYSATPYARLFGGNGERTFGALRRAQTVVVVSHFWQGILADRGLTNTRVIHNGFDVKSFDVSPYERESFRQRVGLTGKPIIYLGREGPGRGAMEAFAALRELDAHFVVSSPSPTPNAGSDQRLRRMHLPFRDYVRLLSAATVVVTMSTFDEGWSRVAHEALLCRTPVLGSGRGGMRELLEGGGQMVCPDGDRLRSRAERLLADDALCARLGDQGRRFASAFTRERFLSGWAALIDEVGRVEG